MHPRPSSLTRGLIVCLAVVVLILGGSAFATTEKALYSFLDQPDGLFPNAGLVADAAGNLYGTTSRGGNDPSCTCGTVFELNPPATPGGAWTETILYTFLGGTTDGQTPMGTLTFDPQGNLYGTTSGGGVNNAGTIFELSPPATAGGAWTESVLWIFPAAGYRGLAPKGKLEMDAEGDLYGTTSGGGKYGSGIVFELIKPKTAGQLWTEKVLYQFGAAAADGGAPEPNLIFRNGVIYGTTDVGGSGQIGIIFQLVRNNGVWTENALYSFNGSTGENPIGGLTIDGAGNLYGTAHDGGFTNLCGSGCGTIFELSPPAIPGNPWVETTLYKFTGHGDGANPRGKLWRDSSGDLFGTASEGGIKNTSGIGAPSYGTIFKLKAPAIAGGTWTLQPLHDFGGIPSSDGSTPMGELILVNGLLYGTTELGGNQFSNGGTVFSVVP